MTATTASPLEIPGVLGHPLFAGVFDSESEQPGIVTSSLAPRVENIRMGRIMTELSIIDVVKAADAQVREAVTEQGHELNWGEWTLTAAGIIAEQISTKTPAVPEA